MSRHSVWSYECTPTRANSLEIGIMLPIPSWACQLLYLANYSCIQCWGAQQVSYLVTAMCMLACANFIIFISVYKVKVKHPCTGLDRPWGFQEVGAPGFQDHHHMKVVMLSALHTSCLYFPGSIPGTHFCWRLSQPQGHSVAGRIVSMKNSNDNHQELNPWPFSL